DQLESIPDAEAVDPQRFDADRHGHCSWVVAYSTQDTPTIKKRKVRRGQLPEGESKVPVPKPAFRIACRQPGRPNGGWFPGTFSRPRPVCPRSCAMELSPDEKQIRDRFFQALVDAILPLKAEAADPEVALEMLLEAIEALREHVEKELEEVRLEQAE